MDRARGMAWATLAVGAGALGTAFLAQHAGGLEPCPLCLWQRVPYLVVAGLGGLGLDPRLAPADRWTVAVAAGAVFLAGAVIAGYHVGVEQHWWENTACAVGGGASSVEALKQQLAAAPRPCDEPAWTLFGVSMAGYNLLASLGLGALWVGAGRRGLRRTAQGRTP